MDERFRLYIWFTGLSAFGKSTIAHKLEKVLFEKRAKTCTFMEIMFGTFACRVFAV